MVAEWWALGISILALIATLTKDFFVPFIFKPRLKVEGIDDGECVENACDNMNHPSTWVRLRLSNKKSFFSKPAENCYVKLLGIKNKNGEKIMPFSPTPLMWVTYDNFNNDLAIGEYHLI